jgi:hypothetical protein
MRRAFTLLALVLVVLGLASVASAAPSYEKKAIQAARQAGCLPAGKVDVWADVQIVSSCFAGGFITEAAVIYRPTVVCSNPETNPCPTPMPIVVATVQFGCDDEIVSVTCY